MLFLKTLNFLLAVREYLIPLEHLHKLDTFCLKKITFHDILSNKSSMLIIYKLIFMENARLILWRGIVGRTLVASISHRAEWKKINLLESPRMFKERHLWSTNIKRLYGKAVTIYEGWRGFTQIKLFKVLTYSIS